MKDFYCDEVLSQLTPVQRVLESKNFLAFHHTKPSWPVHIVVISKQHIASIGDFPDDERLLGEMMKMLRRVMADVSKEHGGCRLTTNMGNCQITKHLHWHIYVGEPQGRVEN